MRSHKQLDAWKESMALVDQIYNITKIFPREELYGLTNQIRRCAISIPSNIAEGAARNSKKEFVQFLGIARGSLSELETQLLIAKNLGYFKDTRVFDHIEIIFKLIAGLINSVKNSMK